MRYYFRNTAATAYAPFVTGGYFPSSVSYNGNVMFPVQMRVAPTALDYSALLIQDEGNSLISVSAAAIDGAVTNVNGSGLILTVTGATAARFGRVLANNNTAAFLGFSAEL